MDVVVDVFRRIFQDNSRQYLTITYTSQSPCLPLFSSRVQAMAAPHMSRESTVKLLEALKSAKIKRVADLRNAEIATALTEVVAKVNTAGCTSAQAGLLLMYVCYAFIF